MTQRNEVAVESFLARITLWQHSFKETLSHACNREFRSKLRRKATAASEKNVVKHDRAHTADVKKREIGYFAPKTWAFWRSVITCFCLFSIVGHWLEIPYCTFMHSCFGIVEADYAVWTDPWYHPYWIYGIGAVIVTLLIEPLKEWTVSRRKTLVGAILETFVLLVIISMLTELIMGWLVNQPDEFGDYPFWNNSELPLNIFGQAWLVNDIVIGVVATLYVWVLYPLICEGYMALRPKTANIVFAILMVAFAACCTISYIQLAL